MGMEHDKVHLQVRTEIVSRFAGLPFLRVIVAGSVMVSRIYSSSSRAKTYLAQVLRNILNYSWLTSSNRSRHAAKGKFCLRDDQVRKGKGTDREGFEKVHGSSRCLSEVEDRI